MEIIPITIDELLERYAAGERDFTPFGIEYTERDLKGVNLSGATFGIRTMEFVAVWDEVDFSKANLSGAWLDKRSIENANLRGANLSKASLYQAGLCNSDLRGADFREASLMYTDLRYAKVDGADFRGANLSEARWHGTRLTNVNFKGAIDPYFVLAIFDNTIMPDGTIRSS